MRTFDYPRGYQGNLHRHREAQLVYPIRGVVSVATAHGEWLASPMRAVAIPAWQPHRVSAEGNTLLHSLFVDPSVYPQAMPALRMVQLTPLLHELIRESGRFFGDYAPESRADRMLRLLVDLLEDQEPVSAVWLPEIRRPRLRRAVEETSGWDLRTSSVAKRAAYSTRQFARTFRQDTGMTFKDWRALYRLHAAVRLLANGSSVSDAAAELGFSSASAFISVFRRHLGTTPGAFFRGG